MSVLCADVWCWARCSHVVLCSCNSWGGSRFTYCMLTNREEDICCSSSTTRLSIQLIPHSYPFPLLEETTRHLRSHSWFWSCNVHWVIAICLGFPSLLFLFGEGKVHLVATWPWGCHREHFSWGSWLLLAAKSHTCITWKALHRFHRLQI